MTDVSALICETQGQLYKYIASLKYDMNVFSDVFMKSDFCRCHFDTIYSPYQIEFPIALCELCMPEVKDKLIKSNILSEDDRCYAEAVGYMYRKLYHKTSIPSAELAQIVPYNEIINRLSNDADWFEVEHRGEIGVFEDIVKEHNLPLKRYDSDIVLLTDEQMEEIEEQTKREHENLCKKYLSNKR